MWFVFHVVFIYGCGFLTQSTRPNPTPSSDLVNDTGSLTLGY